MSEIKLVSEINWVSVISPKFESDHAILYLRSNDTRNTRPAFDTMTED